MTECSPNGTMPLRSRPHPQKPTTELRKKKPSVRPSDNKTPAEILREYIG